MLLRKYLGASVLILSICTASLRAQLVPISRTLHAQATAGGNSDNPPDLIVAGGYGDYQRFASTNGNGQTANASAASGIQSDQSMLHTLNATATYTGTGAPPFASAFQDTVFDILQPMVFREITSGTVLNNSIAVHYTISEQALGLVRSQNHFESASFTNPSVTFTLDPGRYTLHLDGQSTAGGGAPGGGSFSVRLTPIPEPTVSATCVIGMITGLARRHRRPS